MGPRPDAPHVKRVTKRGAGWAAALLLATLASAGCSDLLPIPRANDPGPDLGPDTSLPGDIAGLPTEEPTHANPDASPSAILAIAALDPAEGDVAGGYDVTIRGNGFREGLAVYFDETPSELVFVASTTTAIARVPPHPAGRVDVAVAHPDSDDGRPQILPTAFRYFSGVAITAVTPARGPTDGGIPIAVEGRGFAPDGTLFVGGRPVLAPLRESDTRLSGVLPPGAFGPADVQVVSSNGVAIAADAFTFGAPPTLSALAPIVGRATGGETVRLIGHALEADSEGVASVVFASQGSDQPATITRAAPDGSWLEVLSPAAPPGPPGENSALFAGAWADVRIVTRWGVASLARAFQWRDPLADPMVLACTHAVPNHGAEAGGEVVTIACRGLAYGDLAVTFGDAPAELLADPNGPASGADTLQVRTPPGHGDAIITVRTAAADTQLATPFHYDPAPRLQLAAIAPATGPLAGGQAVTLTGQGFEPGMVVQIGALPATAITVLDAEHLTATTPPGAPGSADVIVRSSGLTARLPAGYDFTADTPSLQLITPPTAAQAGGTHLRVFGAGFGPDATLTIGGAPCTPIARVSSAELAVSSPRLDVGTYDAVLSDGAHTATLARALTVYDPRSGYGGTWGPPIDETLNVTVYGGNGYGPVAGAFVLATPARADTSPPPSEWQWQGLTDDRGQVTFSTPGRVGPLDVTASKTGFTSYSVVAFDATNVTIVLQQNPIPDQGNGGVTPPPPYPNATLSGHVLGLGKYVVAPPGSCAALAIADSRHCAPCEDDPALGPGCDDPARPDAAPEAAADFACVTVGDQGQFCAQACLASDDCPAGYACSNSSAGLRCLPSPGQKAAYCNVTSTSDFGYEYPIQETGWVDITGDAAYQLDSRRLGDLAIYCFGGYKDTLGTFLPTAFGVRRHVYALSGATQTDLDVTLDHPLRRSFRVRLMDPPVWPSGLAEPNIAVTLDLGADGAVPFSRKPVPIGDDTYLLPNELASLDRELYDAQYFFYTTLAPKDVAGAQPRSLNFVQNVQRIVEDRFPVRDPGGGWHLEGSQLERDLYAVFAAPAPTFTGATGTRAWAVGERGLILLHVGNGWTPQPSFTQEHLRAIVGRVADAPATPPAPDVAIDLWAVGDHETIRHFTGLAWEAVPGPSVPSGPPAPSGQPTPANTDSFVAAALTDDALYVAGASRLRRLSLADRSWSIVGGPSLQAIRGLLSLPGGEVLALGTGGRVYAGRDSTWRRIPTDTTQTLRAALVRADGTLVVVGDRGTILVGLVGLGASLAQLDLGLTTPPLPVASTPYDLTALTETPDRTLVVVGDHGTALVGPDPATLHLEPIDDYRSKAFGALAEPDGRVRVVGSAAFILGPFLHFPIVTAPLHAASLDSLAFGWTWDGGPANQYTRLDLTPEGQITLWTLIVDGAVTTAYLPDLQTAAGITALPSQSRMRLGVLRVLNQNFDIDDYTTREFSIYARDSWTTNEAWFYLP